MCLADQRHAHAMMWYAPCNRANRIERKMHGEWNEKCTVNDVACNGTFHVTDNPPIKWQGSAWVLYNINYFEKGFPSKQYGSDNPKTI